MHSRSQDVLDNKLLAALPHERIAHDLPLTTRRQKGICVIE
jgi:hypothetical protein